MSSSAVAGILKNMMLPTTVDAFNACAVQCRSQFLATARRLLNDPVAAQDAVQDAMLSAARNLHRFRGDSQLSTWLGRIVINAALTQRRAVSRRPEESLETLLERPDSREYRRSALVSSGPSAEETLVHGERQSRLRAAVDELPHHYRTVVIMRYFGHARIAEIAARLHITPNAAKLRLLRAHRMLRGLLAQRGFDHDSFEGGLNETLHAEVAAGAALRCRAGSGRSRLDQDRRRRPVTLGVLA
jgi:RNA polymerase sigma-70 factor, ECF subfamily